jgi:hypothetical protein
VISKPELADLARDHAVLSTKLLAGRTLVRVYSDGPPGAGFEAAEPDLEDVYFSTMTGHIGRRAATSLRTSRDETDSKTAQ